MRGAAVEVMLPFLSERFANPSGAHRFARDARRAVDEARDVVAEMVGVSPGEVVFTGCGTEADNAAIAGVVGARGGRAVCSAAEHHAVLHAVARAGGTVVGVDRRGHIDLDHLADALGPDVSLVSVMAVNNEVGTITDLGAVAAVVRRRAPEALLHTDAIQAAPWLDLRRVASLVDLMSLSGHKFGGPKGVGVLTVRDPIVLRPLLVGGGQERDRRSGTHNVAGIVAFAEALRCADAERDVEVPRIALLRDRLVSSVLSAVDDAVETVAARHKVAGAAHVCFAGIESEALLYLLDEASVYASAASACASGAMEPSHVLAAMGVESAWSAGALRMSIGHTTTDADIDRAVDVLSTAVPRLRSRRRI